MAKSKAVAKNDERLKRLAAYGKAAASKRGSIVGSLIKFSKGEYLAGQDEDELPLGTKLVLAVDSVLIGWTRWEDNKVAEQEMGPVVDGHQPKRREELGHTDKDEWESDANGTPRDPWQFGNQMLMKGIGKGGDMFTFTTTSKGGIGAVGKLIEEVVEEYVENNKFPDPEEKTGDYPIIKLGRDFYKHPTYGKVWVPTFEIVGWSPVKDFGAAPADEPKQAKKPVKGQKALTY